jgi:ABC-type nitrate/sulfonate/bicarbonate transport system permease component
VWRFLTTGPVGADARQQLVDASITTLTDAGIGLFAGAAIAILVALTFNLAPAAEQTFMPMAIVLRSVPLVAMTPLIALIFGRGLMAVTVIAGLVTFFPVLVNVSLALRSAPKAAIDLCHAYGADAATTLRKVQIPTALPALFASLRIAAPLALVGALLAEWLSTGHGLGYLMLQSGSLSNYNMLWSATALVTIYSIVAYSLIAAIEKIALAKYSDVRA